MKITYPIPVGRVAEYVKGMLVIERSQASGTFTLPLFANGTPTLVASTTGCVRLFGQTVRPSAMTIEGAFTLIAYFLRPYSVRSLFGLPANELTDHPLDLDLLLAKGGLGLRERLMNALSPDEMITLIDGFLFGLIAASDGYQKVIDYATERIARSPANGVLSDVRRELCVTERTFQRLFERNVGVSPSQFRKIVQFNRAFRQLNGRRFRHLTDIAFDNGYADQSHFIRAFRRFTGITPGEYLQLSSAVE